MQNEVQKQLNPRKIQTERPPSTIDRTPPRISVKRTWLPSPATTRRPRQRGIILFFSTRAINCWLICVKANALILTRAL